MPPVNKPTASTPKLVNRGAAGLLKRLDLTPEQVEQGKKVQEAHDKREKKQAKNRIAVSLQGMTVDIEALVPDPDNARLHPEQNMAAICDSLYCYGQVKPIVVNTRTNIVVAGNGTLAAAKKLGWKDIAVSYVDMSDAEAAAYGLADNRTAELATWDYEVMKRLDALIATDGGEMIGWKLHELEVLRNAEWVKPIISDETFGGNESNGADEETDPSIVSFSPEEYEQVGPAIARMKDLAGNEDMSQAAALRLICQEWTKAELSGRLEGLDDANESFNMSNECARANGLTEEG